jgi:hypothetical protein
MREFEVLFRSTKALQALSAAMAAGSGPQPAVLKGDAPARSRPDGRLRRRDACGKDRRAAAGDLDRFPVPHLLP